jgi:predicted phage terminase large subunit-like protein
MSGSAKSAPDKTASIILGPQPGPQTDFLCSPADIAIFGGSRGGGKSFALLLEVLRNTPNSRFASVVFRRTYPQIQQEGGLWDTSRQIFPYVGAVGSQGSMTWKFKSGATVSFRHMENDDDRYDWLGASIPLICFDELCTFTEEQFFFMLGSNRSTCGIRPYIRATTNPEAKSWVSRFIQWWWNPETGYPIPGRSGKLRWFVRVKDHIEWADTAEELRKEYPILFPKSATFIPASVHDNKILLQKDPGYLSNLMALPLVDRERYLHGNWRIDSAGGVMFKREWFRIVPQAPAGLHRFVRFWDVAASEAKNGRDPDWTAGVLMSEKDGQWIVCDVKRFRGSALTVEGQIAQVAQNDPRGTMIRMEQEPGASGKMVIDHYARHILKGYNFLGIPSRRNKVLRAGPLSSAAESGNLILVRGDWNSIFIDECESFRGFEEKNDQVDAASGAQEALQEKLGHWKFAMPVGVSGESIGFTPSRPGRYIAIGT